MSNNDQKLKDIFTKMQDPLPDEAARERAFWKALDVYDRNLLQESEKNEKKFKGIENGESLTGKIKRLISFKGVPVMTRPVFAAFVAVIAVGVFLSLKPTYFTKNAVTPIISQSGDTAVQSEMPLAVDGDKTKVAAKPAVEDEAVLKEELKEAAVPAREKQQVPTRVAIPSPAADVAGSLSARCDSNAMGMADSSVSSYPAPGLHKGKMTDIIEDPYSRYVGRDRFEKTGSNPVKLVAEEPASTFSIDVDTASYSFMRRQLNNGVLPQKNAIRIEELINYFDYDYAVPADRSQPFKPTVAVYPAPWNKDGHILHVGIKGYDIAAKEKPRSNLVFLLDVSGSMNSPDKLPLLKNAFRMLVGTLEQNDSVAIVVYAGAAGVVLEPTKAADKGKILAALDRLKAGGSTAGGQGIRLAYSLAQSHFDADAVNRVILATDGDFNVGITDRAELKSFIERKRKTGIYLSVLGFGQGNYNDALMQALAQNGNGNASYIDNLNEARKVLVEESSSTLFPIAKDVKIQIEFNPAKVVDYRLIGYETRMLKREDFNNDQVDAGEVGAGHSVTALYEITTVDSGRRFIDDLRYQPKQNTSAPQGSNEYGFLKIRYKLPQESKSRLLSRPITVSDAYTNNVPQEIRFAGAVAAFGQLLKGMPYTKDFDYDDVIQLAEPARGRDLFGYRSEFINLVRLAKSARDM